MVGTQGSTVVCQEAEGVEQVGRMWARAFTVVSVGFDGNIRGWIKSQPERHKGLS